MVALYEIKTKGYYLITSKTLLLQSEQYFEAS